MARNIGILLVIILIVGVASQSFKKCGIGAEISYYDGQQCVCPEGFYGDPYKECEKIPENICENNPCGPNSECIDDEDYDLGGLAAIIGPHCICESFTFGFPPNCIKQCMGHDSCKSDEYCDEDTRKCEKGCRTDGQCESNEFCSSKSHACEVVCTENTCGSNSICNVVDHKRYCSCKNGFIPERNVGCRQQNKNETNIDFKSLKNDGSCYKYCGYGAECEVYKNKLNCACNGNLKNKPFTDCALIAFDLEFRICDCCKKNLRPGCEVPINPNLLKTLLG